MSKIPKEFPNPQSKDKKASAKASGDKPVKASQGNSLTESRFAQYAYGYATLSILKSIIAGSGPDALSLVNHWQLDRKLRETLNRMGTDGGTAWNAVEIMKTILARAGAGESASKEKAAEKPAAKKTARDIAQTIILENYSAADFRGILGINVFDDVTWFNKEAFDRAMLFAPIFAALECGDFT
jgi:hypothetical protein